MKNKKYENYQDFIIAFDSTPEEIIKRETYDLLKLYNQTQQQLATYKQKEDKFREYIKQNTLWLDSIDNQVYTIYGYNSDRIAIVEVDDLLEILNEEGDK